MIFTYFQQALKNHRKTFNLFIYGVPPTCKTEITRTLHRALMISAYNITYMEYDRDVVKADQLLIYSCGCSFLVKQQEGDFKI